MLILKSRPTLLKQISFDNFNCQDAIGCLASITDPSITKKIFVSSLERLQLINDFGDCVKEGFLINSSVDNDETNATSKERDAER